MNTSNSTSSLKHSFSLSLFLASIVTFICVITLVILTYRLAVFDKRVASDFTYARESYLKILYYDEVLTSSGRAYVHTAQEKWLEKYDQYEKLLDSELKTLIDRANDPNGQRIINDLKSSNELLLALEKKALNAQEGERNELSKQILYSPTYFEYKARFLSSTLKLADYLGMAFSNRVQKVNERNFLYLIIIAFISLISVSFWVIFFSMTKRKVDMIQQQVDEKHSFLLLASHEIRSPMTGLLGMVELLQSARLTKTQQEMLEAIKSCGDSLILMLDDISDIGSLEFNTFKLENRNFDLSRSLNEVAYIVSYKLSKKAIDLSINTSTSVPNFLYGDDKRLRQVIRSALLNIAKDMENGSLLVSVSVNLEQHSNFDLIFKVHEVYSTKIQESIERRFRRGEKSVFPDSLKPHFNLSLVEKVIQQMEGSIHFVNDPTYGSTMVLRFPFRRGVAEADVQDSSLLVSSDSDHTLGVKILVVEDNQINQKLITLMLEKIGYSCDVVSDGLEAIDAVGRKKYSIVFMDLEMPRLGGIEATKKIISIYKEESPRIIALTANVFAQDRSKCLEAGMIDFVTKPIEINELKRAIFKYGGGATVSAANLSAIDINMLRENFNNDEALFKEILMDFKEQLPSYLDSLESSLISGEFGEAARSAHTLKGLLLGFGCTRAARHATVLERLARDQSADGVKELLEQLRSECLLAENELGDIFFSRIATGK